MELIQILVAGTQGPDDLRTLEQDATLARIANKNSSTTRPEFTGYVIYPDGTLTNDYSQLFFVNEFVKAEFLKYMQPGPEARVAIINIYGQPIQYNLIGEEVVDTTPIVTEPTSGTSNNTTIIRATIVVNILPAVIIPPVTYTINVNVLPAETKTQTKTLSYGFNIKLSPLEINLSRPIINKAYEFLADIVDGYVDEDRELRTLLNFGEDRQNVVLAYRYGNKDILGLNTLQVKLLNPVPDDIAIGNSAFISLELAKTTIDKVRVRFAPPIDATPYLRPKNMSAKANISLGKSVNNVTLQLLSLDTGSYGSYDSSKNISFEDQLYRRWYSFDFNSSELNIDFTDYNNFVFYGSAALRLEAFKQKLYRIESLTSQSIQFEGSVFTGSLASAGAAYILEQSANLSKEKETIIRSFDRYEQFLYFTTSGSNLPYTASAWYADGGYEYNPIAYWPKDASGSLYSPYSTQATEWLATQSAIAQRFDEFNENNLINTIPTHIREDDDNASYITFVAMIGHFFDIIKPYIDQFPYVYSRYTDPNEELSKDLVTDIAESVGFPLPTLNSIYSISDNVLGTAQTEPRRDYTVETHKRLLHNLPFFAKSKGTRTALSTLLKSFGINEQLINIGETGTSETSSLYVFDEFSTGLDFNPGENVYIKLPIIESNRIPLPKSLQFNLTVAESKNMTILTAGNSWALHVTPHPTLPNLGRFELTSGSNQELLLSSSYQEIFGDELLNVSIRTYDTGSYATLAVTQVDGEDVIFESIMSEPNGANKFVPLWTSSAFIALGGSGSLVTGSYNGTIDEVRLWGTNLSNEMTLNTAFDPGSNAGDVYTDASNYLYVQLSFNKIDTGSLPTYLINESPYAGKDGSPSLEILEVFGNITLSSFSRYNRTVRQLLPDIGSSGYVTRKIKIAPPATFKALNVNANGVKQLSRTKSIVAPSDKRVQTGRNKVSISTSPTQIINQAIIRNIGLENINAALGIPIELSTTFQTTLEKLKKHYAQYYYVDVNINQYIRVLSEVNSILNQVVDYFIPSKATLLRGVTIEPNILERKKIPILKNLRFYGANTRKTQNAAGSLTGSKADYGATFNLSQKINVVTPAELGGAYSTFDTQHEDWYETSLISQSFKQSKKVSIDITPKHSEIGEYKVYDIQSEDWYNNRLISQSKKIPKKSSIKAVVETDENGTLSVYQTQHENWWDARLISQSKKVARQSRINLQNDINNEAAYFTYGVQHEDWYNAKLISQSLKTTRPATINKPIGATQTDYTTVGTQHEDWLNSKLISQSIKPPRVTRIKVERDINGSYEVYNLQHLDWAEYRKISSSYVSGTVEYVSHSYLPWPKQAIDLGLTSMNKFGYNATNKGSEGTEPYNRLYTRKLYDYEIESTRAGGVTSLYPKALYEIPPSADFRDVGVYTYFNSPEGIYYYPKIAYTPRYVQPLNPEWNFATQEFVGGAPTWSYGQRYNINDVVYQEVNDIMENADMLSPVLSQAKFGNGKFYVFKTRPSYTPPADGTAFYSGSVPTYIPPSLDKENWARLRFRPVEKREARRIVFDTFTVPDPSLNNYTTTTIDVNKIIDIPDRYLDVVSIGNIPANDSVYGEIALQNIASLFALQSNDSGLRVRLYRTAENRDNDISRTAQQFPNVSSGVLLDMTINEPNSVILTNPIVNLVAGSNPPLGKIFYTITNTTNTIRIDANLLFYYFAIEIEARVPTGYLRKHYRFFRDNSTATKRRNWVGCKNTVNTTIDGLPPVQIFVGDGTQLVVSPTQTNDEIITGGGGTLNVT